MNYTPATVTPEQRANLELLYERSPATEADYPFNMTDFTDDERSPAARHKCGTVACFAGRGPMCGVEARRGDDWFSYSERVFTSNNDEWRWLFYSMWAYTDNTLAGARARVRVLLDHGLPENWRDQRLGRAPLCYTEEDP